METALAAAAALGEEDEADPCLGWAGPSLVGVASSCLEGQGDGASADHRDGADSNNNKKRMSHVMFEVGNGHQVRNSLKLSADIGIQTISSKQSPNNSHFDYML